MSVEATGRRTHTGRTCLVQASYVHAKYALRVPDEEISYVQDVSVRIISVGASKGGHGMSVTARRNWLSVV